MDLATFHVILIWNNSDEEQVVFFMAWTIYCHTHIVSNRRYVGLTSRTWQRRWAQHLVQARSRSSGWSHFPNAIRKYGKDAFSHEVLETCDTLEAANAAEERWIEELGTRDPTKGFNTAKGGGFYPNPEKKNPWDRPEFREKMLSVALPRLIAAGSLPSTRAASRATLATPEGKAALSRGVSRHYLDPVNRARQSESVKALHRDPVIHASFQKGLKTAGANKKAQTHCKEGHKFTPKNTYLDAKGWRHCRKCMSDRVSKATYDSRTHCANGHPLVDGNFKFCKNGRSRVCLLCSKTHCKKGHELTPENTHVQEKPHVARICLTCRRARGRALDAVRRQKKREARSPAPQDSPGV